MNNKINDIYNLIYKKKTNIILAYDNNDFPQLCHFLSKIYPYIIGLKIHNEILNLNPQQNITLYNLCKCYSLFLWEDRKFNDISNTVIKQLKKYENVRDYISICPISGPDLLKIKSKLGFFVLIEMSSDNNLFNNLTDKIYNWIIEEKNNVNNSICGIICQDEKYFNIYSNSKDLITIKPGIHLTNTKDDIGQTYTNPQNMINKPTLFVIGRGITQSEDPIGEIKKYISITYTSN